MTTITLPRELVREGELTIIPRREYEDLLNFRLSHLNNKEVVMTPAQKQALMQARKNFHNGHFLTFNELKTKLAVDH